MMLVHNFFFLILSFTLFALLRPVYNEIVDTAQERTEKLVRDLMRNAPEELGRIKSDWYIYREGSADDLGIPQQFRNQLHSDTVWEQGTVFIRQKPNSKLWIILHLDKSFAEHMVMKFNLMLVVGLLAMYTIGVLALELIILPHYVYKPIDELLRADIALQQGDRKHELVDSKHISGDEFGKIIASRNLVVTLFRKHEEQLTNALAALEEVAADLKRKNHLLETAKQNLADQDRLVSLGMLSAGVAHELNTPLAVLRGSIQKLLETTTEPTTLERLERMLRVTERLQRISESLVDFARARDQIVSATRLYPLIDEAWSLVQIEPGARHISLHNSVPESCFVIANADRLVQVFVNLFRNSVSAIQSKGNIYVGASLRTDEPKWTVITVEDDGVGIDPNILPRVFEPFISGKLDARGTGLGLAVAEGIIKQHGGMILATNRACGGARFEIMLPTANPNSAEVA